MQFGQIAAEARPRQHRADDDVPQRVADEAAGRRHTAFRQVDGKTVPPILPTHRTTLCNILQYMMETSV